MFCPRYATFHYLTMHIIKNNISHCYLVAQSITHRNYCLIATDCLQLSLPPVIHMCNCNSDLLPGDRLMTEFQPLRFFIQTQKFNTSSDIKIRDAILSTPSYLNSVVRHKFLGTWDLKNVSASSFLRVQ